MFVEIAFQAELDRHTDPESKEQAYILCAEEPETRAKCIEELRNMIYERGECLPPRMDDGFLLRFLRARRSVPARAHRLLVRYCHFREQHPHLWKGVDAFGLARLQNVYEGVLFDRPDVGRLIILRMDEQLAKVDTLGVSGHTARYKGRESVFYSLGLWDPDIIPVEELLQGCLALLEVGIMQPKLQILGGTAMVDCEGMTMKQVRQFTPSVAMQIFHIMGYGFPLHQRGCHVINCSKVFETLFSLFKRFAPDDHLWNRVFFHGYDLKSLHRKIDPECLPERYGGYRKSVSVELWLNKIKHYKNETFDRDLRKLGYYVE